MKNDLGYLLAFALKHASKQSLRKRARLYRGLARACGDPREERQLAELADALLRTEELCRGFKFSCIQQPRQPSAGKIKSGRADDEGAGERDGT